MITNVDSTKYICEKNVVVPQKNEPKKEVETNCKIKADSAVIINTKTDTKVPSGSVLMSKENPDKFSAAGVVTSMGVASGLIAFCFRSGGPKSMLLGAGIGAALGAGFATFVNADSDLAKFAGLSAGAAPLFGTIVYASTGKVLPAVLAGVGGGALIGGYVLGRSNSDKPKDKDN